MSEPAKNPFDMLIEQIREVVREEIRGANGNGHDSFSLLSAEQAAKRWNVPKTWISEAARRGELQSVRLGHYVRFRLEDLQAFVEAQKKP